MIEPVTLLAAARTIAQLAHAAGFVRTSADRALEAVAKDVKSLVEAPMHEGLDRVVMAASVSDPARQDQLLNDARSKFHDVAARVEVSRQSAALACCMSAALARRAGQMDEAQTWMSRALEAYDDLMKATFDAIRYAADRDGLKGDWLKLESKAMTAGAVAGGAAAGGVGAAAMAAGAAVAGPALLGAIPVFFGARLAYKAYQSHLMRDLPTAHEVGELNNQVSAALAFALELGVDGSGHCRELKVDRLGGSWKVELLRVS